MAAIRRRLTFAASSTPAGTRLVDQVEQELLFARRRVLQQFDDLAVCCARSAAAAECRGRRVRRRVGGRSATWGPPGSVDLGQESGSGLAIVPVPFEEIAWKAVS